MQQHDKSRLLQNLVEKCDFEEIVNLSEVWIFGYGSLVWLPNFDFTEKRTGRIHGWERRFYQGNSTHRGVPNKPGRVATLINATAGVTYGCAYKLCGKEQISAALDHLNMRESTLGGYMLDVEQFYCEGSSLQTPVLLYTATPENSQFTGVESIVDLAKVIAFSRGPSGTNCEYLFRLVKWQRENLPHIHDGHLYDLDKATRKLIDTSIHETRYKGRRSSNASMHLPYTLARSTE